MLRIDIVSRIFIHVSIYLLSYFLQSFKYITQLLSFTLELTLNMLTGYFRRLFWALVRKFNFYLMLILFEFSSSNFDSNDCSPLYAPQRPVPLEACTYCILAISKTLSS